MAESKILLPICETVVGREARATVASHNEVCTLYIYPQGKISSVTPAIAVDFGNGFIRLYRDTGSGWTDVLYLH